MKENNLKKLQKELGKYKYKCKEGCYSCCTAISFLEQEKKLMDKELKKNGFTSPSNGKGEKYCEYLTTEGRCSIYHSRPIVCRSFSNINFIFKGSGKSVGTQKCTYGEEKQVLASKEFMEYGIEVLNKGIYNKNAKNVMQDFINKYPLFDIPEHLK